VINFHKKSRAARHSLARAQNIRTFPFTLDLTQRIHRAVKPPPLIEDKADKQALTGDHVDGAAVKANGSLNEMSRSHYSAMISSVWHKFALPLKFLSIELRQLLRSTIVRSLTQRDFKRTKIDEKLLECSSFWQGTPIENRDLSRSLFVRFRGA